MSKVLYLKDIYHFVGLSKSQTELDKDQLLKLAKKALADFTQQQFLEFQQAKFQGALTLIQQKSAFTDELLTLLWQELVQTDCLSLIAVGGYGFGELQPYSDVDLLILKHSNQATTRSGCSEFDSQISKFITFLWDIGFEVGHAVRDLAECLQAGLEDIATATNLLDARLLIGSETEFLQLKNLWQDPNFWSSKEFFSAKLAEQKQRHKKFHHTTYQLEPNIKESPGGLRDLQTISWVARRHWQLPRLEELVAQKFLSRKELNEFNQAYQFLSQVRFYLHYLKRRREDRLLLEYQQQLATDWGFKDEEQLAVEQFMKLYYRNLKVVVELNEILLQHFAEEFFQDKKDSEVVSINQRFQTINSYLDVKQDDVFQQLPSSLFEIFIILQDSPDIVGIRARTLRLMRENLNLIDESFRADPINKTLFIAIFRQVIGLERSLRRMHNYGLLDAYLPSFNKISGLMQFNIFHAYTVDEHTILVVRYLHRFFIKEFGFEFPTAHQVACKISRPEVLFLAGLFHDIAKGRNGSHEVLGEVDAREFAQNHKLPAADVDLIGWLVRHHLDFSQVAQHKDLSDPEVILDFARLVENQNNLNHLYLLTLADVRATSDEVWNDWKNALFLELYNETSNALDKELKIPQDKAKIALAHQEKARKTLELKQINSADYQELWQSLQPTEFFNRQNPNEISRITELLYARDPQEITINLASKTQRGASELLIYMETREYLFTQITQELDRLNLNILEAKIYSTDTNHSLLLVYFLDAEQELITDPAMLLDIETRLTDALSCSKEFTPVANHTKLRRIRHFKTPTTIEFKNLSNQATELSISTKDIPGLLSRIGQAFKVCETRLHEARINTVGEKAEDTFVVSSLQNQALNEQEQQKLTAKLQELLF